MTDTKPTIGIAECKHRRYCVDVHEQTGKCYDCGASGKMRFIVDDAELAAIRSAELPVEPEQIKMMRYDEPEGRSDYERAITEYIDALKSALQVAQQEILDTTWQDHADHWKKRAEQAEKDREICYASLQDMRHRLHEIAALSADPRLDEKHAEQTFKEHCFWIQDSDGSWGTGCGHCFEFNHGGPDENEAKFCMYCGLPMAAQSYEEEK